MTPLERRFDGESWRWEWSSGVTPGPAGLGSVWVAEGVRVDADAWSGTILSIIADADDSAGRLAPAADAAISTIVDPAGGVRPEAVVALSRLARVAGAADELAAFGVDVGAADEERRSVRVLLGLDSATAQGARPAPAVLGIDKAADQLRSLPHDLGSLGSLGRLTGGAPVRVAVDPSTVPEGIVDLAGGVLVGWDDDRTQLRVEFAVVAGIYAVEVQRLSCLVVDRRTDALVAVGQVGVGRGTDELAAGVASLVVSATRNSDDLELIVTDRPTDVPGAALRAARCGTHLASTAAVAARLGADGLRDTLLERSLERWAANGRRFDDVGATVAEAPFASDLTARVSRRPEG